MTLRTFRPIAWPLTLAVVATLALALRGIALGDDLPPGFDQFVGVSVWADGPYAVVVVQTSAVPNHHSPYFFPNDPRYEPYNGPNPNFQQNPNHILAQTIEFRIPSNPAVAMVHQATPLGPIGVTTNGVPLFNQYAGPNQPLTTEINSFDQYNGHPQQTGMYHYHFEPLYLTAENRLLGFLLDGFPVYSSAEDGETITNADLDQYHGHVHATAEYPSGIYHYHFTAEAPYLNGTGFYGMPGTVTYSFSSTPTPSATASAVGGDAQLPDAQGDPAGAGTSKKTGGKTGGAAWLAVAGAMLLAGAGGCAWFLRRARRG